MTKFIFFTLVLASSPASAAQLSPRLAPAVPPPPVVKTPASARNSKADNVSEPRTMPARRPLVSPVQARSIMDRFNAAYPSLGRPRLLICVNRELVDQLAALNLSPRTEKSAMMRNPVTSALVPNSTPLAASDRVTAGEADRVSDQDSGQSQTSFMETESRHRLRDHDIPTLADKQTAREIERLFGRAFRAAGAAVVEQPVATALLGDSPITKFTVHTEGGPAGKERDALKQAADVVIEILIAPRNVPLPGAAEATTYVLPDLQATATRLSDSKIIGQIAATDVMGRVLSYATRPFDLSEITEVTALALMEDLMMQAK